MWGHTYTGSRNEDKDISGGPPWRVTNIFHHIRSRLWHHPGKLSWRWPRPQKPLCVRAFFTFILAMVSWIQLMGEKAIRPSRENQSPHQRHWGRGRAPVLGEWWPSCSLGRWEDSHWGSSMGKVGVSVSGSLHIIFWTLERYWLFFEPESYINRAMFKED